VFGAKTSDVMFEENKDRGSVMKPIKISDVFVDFREQLSFLLSPFPPYL
jgi:hypothetical protein